jgi:hypothetical protein
MGWPPWVVLVREFSSSRSRRSQVLKDNTNALTRTKLGCDLLLKRSTSPKKLSTNWETQVALHTRSGWKKVKIPENSRGFRQLASKIQQFTSLSAPHDKKVFNHFLLYDGDRLKSLRKNSAEE